MAEQVKVFTASDLAEGLEAKLSTWLREKDPKITRVVQSSAGSPKISGGVFFLTVLTVFYTPKPN